MKSILNDGSSLDAHSVDLWEGRGVLGSSMLLKEIYNRILEKYGKSKAIENNPSHTHLSNLQFCD
jgi:hypothetical protein